MSCRVKNILGVPCQYRYLNIQQRTFNLKGAVEHPTFNKELSTPIGIDLEVGCSLLFPLVTAFALLKPVFTSLRLFAVGCSGPKPTGAPMLNSGGDISHYRKPGLTCQTRNFCAVVPLDSPRVFDLGNAKEHSVIVRGAFQTEQWFLFRDAFKCDFQHAAPGCSEAR